MKIKYNHKKLALGCRYSIVSELFAFAKSYFIVFEIAKQRRTAVTNRLVAYCEYAGQKEQVVVTKRQPCGQRGDKRGNSPPPRNIFSDH